MRVLILSLPLLDFRLSGLSYRDNFRFVKRILMTMCHYFDTENCENIAAISLISNNSDQFIQSGLTHQCDRRFAISGNNHSFRLKLKIATICMKQLRVFPGPGVLPFQLPVQYSFLPNRLTIITAH